MLGHSKINCYASNYIDTMKNRFSNEGVVRLCDRRCHYLEPVLLHVKGVHVSTESSFRISRTEVNMDYIAHMYSPI